MEKLDFISTFRKQVGKHEIVLTDEQICIFYDYMIELLKWNQKINLTAIIDPKEIIIKHFIDSLIVLPYINPKDKVLDIGTGAGFPGIPLNIVKNDANYILVDSINKRIQFIDQIINKLKLKNIIAIHARAEELARETEYRGRMDIVVSRAVAPLNCLLEYMIPFVKKRWISNLYERT